ncbi:hypothetical protein K1W54_29765 [Micromonospora sp. CPCC 205371]|nr:hypothetical protein [Micromonospora sp. CPCC 205371]
MVTKTRANEFRQEFPLWYYERSAATCVRTAKAAGRRRRMNVDGEPKVRIQSGRVILIWPQSHADSTA